MAYFQEMQTSERICQILKSEVCVKARSEDHRHASCRSLRYTAYGMVWLSMGSPCFIWIRHVVFLLYWNHTFVDNPYVICSNIPKAKGYQIKKLMYINYTLTQLTQLIKLWKRRPWTLFGRETISFFASILCICNVPLSEVSISCKVSIFCDLVMLYDFIDLGHCWFR